jgi:chorismate dehydratase
MSVANTSSFLLSASPVTIVPASPVRVACVSYLNTLPLIAGLEKLSQLQLLPMVPSKIAACVASGEAEVGLCSLIDCERHGLVRLPVGMIGCDGPTMTVRVFSKVPLSDIRTLHADVDSHTSVVLAQVLLRRVYHVPSLHVVPWKDGEGVMGEEPQAMLMIGDKVVLRAPGSAVYPHTLDLGEAWKKLTGLPFVYASWATTRENVLSPRVQFAASLLDRQRRHNAGRLSWIVQAHAAQRGWPVEAAQEYLGSLLRFEESEASEEGARTFLAYAREEKQ